MKPNETWYEGQDIALRCTWLGNPATIIQWKKDGQILDSESGYKIEIKENSSSLTIQNAKKEDNGLFACIIGNETGSNMTRCQVNITRKIN